MIDGFSRPDLWRHRATAAIFGPFRAPPTIKKVELLADHENLLQVYLFELSSVTVAITQALVRIFRNRVGNYLMVLTSDYDRLDFVLIERGLPDDKTEGIGTKQASIRPRILTVDRLKPTRIDQRVLQRFSYTEADPIAQYEKLQAAYIVADWSEEFFNNRALFSDYYLLERLRDESEWKENIKPAFSRFREMYQDAKSLWSGKSEQEFRKGFLNQVFEILGYSFKESKRADDDSKEPDYIFYGDKQTVEPLCFCLTYPWGRSLDGKDYTRDINTPDENPGAVVVSLLDKGKVDWVIVTNGKLWRLYSSKAHSRATNYYEIDLEEVLARLDPEESFRYFYLFFKKEAFVSGSDEEQKKITFLDRLLKGSEEYAKRLGERLKKRVFEEIFPYFAKGFISHIQDVKGVPSLSQSELDRIFQGTLTFLYRLLFLLYSESRNLLPVKEMRGYHEISLSAIKSEIAHTLGDVSFNNEELLSLKIPFDSRSTVFYDRLQTLFRAIDTGVIALNVPAYNGGLFMTTVNPEDDSQEAVNAGLLMENKIPDTYFAIGLDLLTRDEDEKTYKRVFIDYKSLGVRHLGSIYEGLLEFHLRIAPEKMAICEGKKTEEIIPYREAIKQKKKILKTGRGKDAEERILPKGAVYLENTKHERKATGSYYTPDYIVKYIVENTVGPVLKEKFEALTPKFREAQCSYREAVSRAKAFEKKGMKGNDPEKTAFAFMWLVDELFDIKVLDPAMGSGHFLVEAVDFITDKMIDFLNGFPWNPVMATLRETRETILKAMEKQNITIDEPRLNDLNLLKRHVLKRCIYGVDLNPMAVELSKVSLWLDCFTLGAPLSFLDHHLKCGNSLIGATVAEVKEAVEPVSRQISKSKVAASAKEWKEVETVSNQVTLFGSRFAGLMLATDLMRHVGELSDVTAAQVKESRAEYRKASDTLAPFKRMLDIYVSQWFGNEGDSKGKKKKFESSPVLDFLKSKEVEFFINAKDINIAFSKMSETDRNISEIAINTAKEQRFFHWELEFPEVFYDKGKKKENPGFDVVMGNPPYRDLKELDPQIVTLLFLFFKATHNRANLYASFVEKAFNLVRQEGEVSMIVPNSWTTQSSYIDLKKRILHETHLHHLVRIPETAFPEQKVETIIFCCKTSEPSNDAETLFIGYRDDIQVQTIDSKYAQFAGKKFQSEVLGNIGTLWGQISGDADLLLKLDTCSDPLIKVCDISLGLTPYDKYKGHTDVQINSQIYHATFKKDKTYKPLLTGGDISRYVVQWNGIEWISYGDWLGAPREQRFFTVPRILVKQIIDWTSRRIHAGYTSDELYNGQIAFNLIPLGPENPLYILSLLNSRLMNYYHRRRFLDAVKVRFQKILIQDAKKFPIRRINFITPINLRESNIREANKIYIAALTKQSAEDFFTSIKHLLFTKNSLAFDTVHDLLVYLAEQMISMHRHKHIEIKRFLTWLEKALNIQSHNKGKSGFDSLTGKTSIEMYLGDYQKNEEALPFGGLMGVLAKNRSRIGISLSDKKMFSNLKFEYEKSLAILLPIKDNLKKTDWLIDQIVYKLYGLSDEEIKIVEGKD